MWDDILERCFFNKKKGIGTVRYEFIDFSKFENINDLNIEHAKVLLL
jgi:hypothetical protein